MKKYKLNIPEYTLVKRESPIKKVKIKKSADVFEYIKPMFAESIDIWESAFILLLNRSSNTIGWVKISQGGIGGTVVDQKLILKYAINALASGVILVHNHPSGNTYPSEQDKKITKLVKESLKLLDIKLLDHLIITKDKYYSFTDEGL